MGKTHLDELAYSLNGENIHYGTPVNPAAPDRIPGGSSSGSAVSFCSYLLSAFGRLARPEASAMQCLFHVSCQYSIDHGVDDSTAVQHLQQALRPTSCARLKLCHIYLGLYLEAVPGLPTSWLSSHRKARYTACLLSVCLHTAFAVSWLIRLVMPQVATADGAVDIGPSTDTGGSPRVPASHCAYNGRRHTRRF